MVRFRIGNGWYEHRGMMICKNYGGWVIVNGCCCYSIFKALSDAKNYIDKHYDSSHKAEPRVIGKMDREQFINACNI